MQRARIILLSLSAGSAFRYHFSAPAYVSASATKEKQYNK